MLHKGSLEVSNSLKLFCLSLKSIKAILILSLGIIFIVVPIINYGNYKTFGITDDLKILIIHTARRLIPFSCVLPSVLLLRQYVEADGKELMHIYLTKRRILLTLLTVIFSLVLSAVLFVVYSHFFNEMWFEYAKLICISLMLYGLAYFFMSITRTTAISLLILIVYEVFVISNYSSNPVNFVLFNETGLEWFEYWLYLVLIGCFLTIVGERLLRVFRV